MSDPMLPPGKRFCQCTACDEYFLSPGGFGAHRYGPAAEPRCKSTYEMREAGFEQDSRGYWRKPRQEAPKLAGKAA